MARWLYIWLLWRHPPRFRQRFGDEMLDIFDESAPSERPSLLRDAVASLFRQRFLRAEPHEPLPAAPNGGPLLCNLSDYKPSRGAFINAAILSALLLTAFV